MKKDSINAPLIASAVIAATLVALAFALPSPAHERWVMPAFAAIVVVCSLWLVYAVGRSRR